jgi:hypothetical protein
MHNPSRLTARIARLASVPLIALPAWAAAGPDVEELQSRIEALEQQLTAARSELEQAQAGGQATDAVSGAPQEEAAEADDGSTAAGKSTLRVGGAMRVNYAFGDYGPATGGPSRAEGDGGNFALDTFRINLDYSNGPLLGKAEYRFYDGYHFLHTGWLGYDFADGSQIQAGVNRVPFGPGPYGVSQSWFFDQHYYVGLADDMDLGVKYLLPHDNWQFDFAYYYTDEGSWAGDSRQSARYSYDVVNESGTGYEERNQFNVRGIYSFETGPLANDIGLSLQYGQLESNGLQDDGDHYAVSAHMVNRWDNFTLATQLTRYSYDVDAAQPLGTADLVQYGAYDFPSTAAAKAWIPAISLSYRKETPGIDWLDYVVPYIEYSAIIKDRSSFNDSELFMLGAAWANGGWYIYTDLAWSNGNEFIGGETPYGDRLGANAVDDWQYRFNTNFGYYF